MSTVGASVASPPAAIPRSSSRRIASGSELFATIPADLEMSGATLMATRADHGSGTRRRALDLTDHFACPFQVTLVHDPHFRVDVGERNLAQPALQVLVEYRGVDPRLSQQPTHQVRVRQRSGRIDLEHQNKSIWPSSFGGLNFAVSSGPRRMWFSATRLQPILNLLPSSPPSCPP